MEEEQTVEEVLASESLVGFIERVTIALQQAIQQIAPIIAHVYQSLYAYYTEAGMPYGDNPEGCMRWFTEVQEAQRLLDEVERILSTHQGLAYLRKRLSEKSPE